MRSCSNVEEYEARKKDLSDQAAAIRRIFLESQPTFHLFPKLPIELRNRIWASAMAKVTKIRITCSGYTAPRACSSKCGTMSSSPGIYAATALLPPLLLVARKSHAAASKHYCHAFRGVDGGGGIVAAYLTVLIVGSPIIGHLKKMILTLFKK